MSEQFVVPECFRADAKWPGDVIIRTRHCRDKDCEGEIIDFYCHSGVICLSNTFFATALSGEWRESWVQVTRESDHGKALASPIRGMVDMQEEDAETIRELLFYMYPKMKVTITSKNLCQLLTLADKINEPELVNTCQDFALKGADKDPFAVLEVAAIYGLEELFERSSSIILADFNFYRLQAAYIALDSQLRVLFEKAYSQWLQACMQALVYFYRDFDLNKLCMLRPMLDEALVNFESNPSQCNHQHLVITGSRIASSYPQAEYIVTCFKDLKRPRIAWDKKTNRPLELEL